MFFSYLIALTLFDTAVAVPLTANSAKAVPRPRNSVVYISFINNTFLIRNTLYVVHGFPSALYTKLGSFFWHFLSPCFHCYVLPKRMFIPNSISKIKYCQRKNCFLCFLCILLCKHIIHHRCFDFCSFSIL